MTCLPWESSLDIVIFVIFVRHTFNMHSYLRGMDCDGNDIVDDDDDCVDDR